MVACALALVTELKAWKLTPDFCLQEGINFSSGLRCREELEFYESQEQGKSNKKNGIIFCQLQNGVEPRQKFSLRLFCLSGQTLPDDDELVANDSPVSSQNFLVNGHFLEESANLGQDSDFSTPQQPPNEKDPYNVSDSSFIGSTLVKSEPLDDDAPSLPSAALPTLLQPQVAHEEHEKEKPILRTSLGRIYCDFCVYSTTVKGRMKKHIIKHTGDPRYKLYCPLCPFSTVYRTSFNEHLLAQHMDNEDKLACTVCDYRTHYKSNLYRHLMKHTKEKFKKQLSDAKLLAKPEIKKQPLKIRSKESRLPCPYCSFTTLNRNALNDHVNTHIGGPKYACNLCEFSSYYRQNFNRHMKGSHKSDVTYRDILPS